MEQTIDDSQKGAVVETETKNLKIGKKVITFAKWFIFIVGIPIILGWLFTDYMNSKKDGDLSNRYIAVVMSGTDKSFTIPKEFKQGFGDEPKITTSKGQSIRIDKKEDQNSIQQAKIVADKLVIDDKCVLIIGNSNSELTEVTLNSILDHEGIRPAFILPIATADSIISRSSSEGFESILRMVPDNQNQAMIIKRFIFNKIGGKARVAILVDEENQTYSRNLSKNIAGEIIAEDGNIVLNQSYGNEQRFISSYELLKRNNLLPGVIVYVGVSSNGMLLIEELKALNIKIPVIFTDGCTVEELLKKAGQLLGSDAYFLSAVSKSENGLEPTYEPIGKDAYTLAKTILNSIDGPITRQSVTEYIKKNKDKITLDAGFAGAYAFNPEGNNKRMDFKIYTYKNGILTEVKGIK